MFNCAEWGLAIYRLFRQTVVLPFVLRTDTIWPYTIDPVVTNAPTKRIKADQYGVIENMKTNTKTVVCGISNSSVDEQSKCFCCHRHSKLRHDHWYGRCIWHQSTKWRPITDHFRVDGVDYGHPLVLERNYRHWPLVWSATKSIQSASVKGRWTFDTSSLSSSSSSSVEPKQRQRMIYDVTDPLHPKRIVSQQRSFL